jgi:hypothetical protein
MCCAKRSPAEVALQKRPRLLSQDRADRRTIQMGVGDVVLERAEFDRRVILLDDVNHRQPGGRIVGNRESHGVRGAAARKAIATAASVTEVAAFLLMVIVMAFGEVRRGRVAGSAKQIA